MNAFTVEAVAAHYWVVRGTQDQFRKGVVLGGKGRYSAQTMRGELIGHASSVNKAAEMVFNRSLMPHGVGN